MQDVSPQEKEEMLALEIITYVGLGVSIVSLITIIITYTFSR